MRKVARMRIMQESTEATWRIYLPNFLQSVSRQTAQVTRPPYIWNIMLIRVQEPLYPILQKMQTTAQRVR
jgi:hypothetical protein